MNVSEGAAGHYFFGTGGTRRMARALAAALTATTHWRHYQAPEAPEEGAGAESASRTACGP